jgi:hypothetical protein
MTQADRDAERWMRDNAKWQERNLYRAKETGDAYFIDQFGDVVIEKPKKEGENK